MENKNETKKIEYTKIEKLEYFRNKLENEKIVKYEIEIEKIKIERKIEKTENRINELEKEIEMEKQGKSP